MQMALPQLLEATAIPADALDDFGAALVSQRVLDTLQIPHQDQDQWCWCAITAGICAFRDHTFKMRQCEVAAVVLGLDACANPASEDVNKMMPLDEVLVHFHRLADMQDMPISFDQIVEQIDAGLPVCLRIRFVDTGIAHFTVVRGYRRDDQMLMIDDPSFDETTLSYDDVRDSYEGSGVWKQSYRVR